MKKNIAMKDDGSAAPSQSIDAKIAELGGWRGETLARLRAAIRAADPEIIETVKWRKPSNPAGVPVWEHDGIICTGETYKDKVKLTFDKGAALDDPKGLFNASLDGNRRRAIDIFEGDEVDEKALKGLVKAAVAVNGEKKRK
jgi:hypothetical protein